MIFAAGDGPEDYSKSDDNALVVSLARAWQWQEELEVGEYSTVEEVAAAKKIDVSYVRRMLRLNSLAPDIVEAILRDQAPDRISLRTLYRGIAPSRRQITREHGTCCPEKNGATEAPTVGTQGP